MNPRNHRAQIALFAGMIAAATLLAAIPIAGAMGYPGLWERQMQRLASADAAVREAAIAEFRTMGPVGVERLRRFWTDHAEPALDRTRLKTQQQQRLSPATDRVQLTSDEIARLRDAIDRVAGQRDATSAWLYWYTDLDAARAEAARLDKPILSLRLLGELTDEYSCANSRFFRTVLYANPDVAATLRDSYVLHWSSERPVPVVTIDFGDGRLVKRTITGNSIHYVLDSGGRVIDALPGLYAPADFLRILQRAHGRAVLSGRQTDEERRRYLVHYHKMVDDEIARRFGAALADRGVEVPRALRPDAADAAPRAVGKVAIEAPMLVAMDPAWAKKLARELTDEQWAAVGRTTPISARRLGALDPAGQQAAAILHPDSIALMRSQNRQAYDADPALFDRTVARFERLVLIDTARNDLIFRRTIHQWLAEQPGATMPMAALNERVYAELFLTPANDANLGLLPADVYTGHGSGVTATTSVTRR